ncbi:MAG: DHA2 family efflux MFS transporter permease subunit [Halioglobus sp.]|nr:DHA2 family efflux MFS transporter permease subunit [Halioglobus sp.]
MVSTTVMLTTIMVILDMTIVNVSLPYMMGSLGATSDQITWVLTGYIVTTAVCIPFTGYLAVRLGRKRLMWLSVLGFVIASGLCGQARSLAEMVLFRILQGAFGASVVPLSQAVMVDASPGRERGKAMAIWGVGIMLGPIMGPTLGGYITEQLSWRWVFYINVPVGLVNLWLIARNLPPATTVARRQKADWPGALALVLGVGALQFVLDRGNQEDWFASGTIQVLTVIGIVGLALFARRAWTRADSVVQLQLLRDRNLAMSCLMILCFGLGLFGTIVLLPMMLEGLLGYPAQTTGLVMAPRGIASAAGMFLVSRFIGRSDPRKLLLGGLALAASGTGVMVAYTADISPAWVVWPGALQGLGMGMIFVPLSTIAYQTLPREATDQAAGIFNLSRTFGSSIGISVVSTIASRMAQVNWNELGGHINPYNPAVHHWLAIRGGNFNDPLALQLLEQELARQSAMIGFIDTFHFVALSFVGLALLVMALPRPVPATQAAAQQSQSCKKSADYNPRNERAFS